MLNVVNGILFIQIREKDLDIIREELAKQEKTSTTSLSSAAEQAAVLMNNEVD